MINQIKKDIQKIANPEKAKIYQRFFKTGKGQYGEGDVFLGLTVPQQRSIAKNYLGIGLPKIQQLLKSKIHEHRLVALIILVEKYKKAGDEEKGNIFNLYLKNTKFINNWDLIDLTAPNIVGEFLLDKKRIILYNLAESKSLWEKRISVLATFTFIRNNEFKDCLRICEILLKDDHDLIHKACGWMLREIGKRDLAVEEKFLKKHYKNMPRTMLRYAIERFEENKRQKYLKGKIK
ncbi:DNA alkylation repair protein [Candidatus Pacearchaeota archaeon]|nr:DNA alkylation repair protein [Candidatus Pacearchaeota archaeon]